MKVPSVLITAVKHWPVYFYLLLLSLIIIVAVFPMLLPSQMQEPDLSPVQKALLLPPVGQKRPENVKLVPYEGPVKHVFFHPLIIYPERAFDGDHLSKGYDDYFLTVDEFRKILDILYAQNYILVDITSLVEKTAESGKESFQRKTLLLPENKKPLVLSIDDLNYYEYMRQNGNGDKLILDEDGKIAVASTSQAGDMVVSKDEIIPIVDEFVTEHPDFSWQGTKGLIALTGYQGILGYRTDKQDDPGYQQEKEEALKIVKRLKETGWTFASHGYGHLNTNQISLARLESDTRKWHDEVESLVGSTSVYVSPYGTHLAANDPKTRLLVQSGFNILCSVGVYDYLKLTPEAVFMDRMHLDGLALRSKNKLYRQLFNGNHLLDEKRPKS